MSKKNDIFDKVNKLVIAGLEKDGMQWFKPWKGGQENAPFNLAINRYYNGFNIFMLNCAMKAKGYEHNQWLTWNQVMAKGGRVVESENKNYTEVYLWQIGYFDNKTGKFVSPKFIKSIKPNEKLADGKNRYRKTFSVKYFNVYNVAQTTGIKPMVKDEVVTDVINEPNEVAEGLVKNYVAKQNGFEIKHSDNGAYYSPSSDYVNMPPLEKFIDADSYYKTMFHELAHSTGHKSRLNRKTLTEIAHWGDNTYAQEELVAEISAWYIVGLLGLNPKDCESNSQAYIQNWCTHLADKPKECVYAMQQATKAVEFIQR